MSSLLTVLTPSYNRAHTLNECYISLSNQTDNDFEWLIVDDGSVDNTRALVEEFQANANFPIRYIYKNNGGKHTALNIGISNIDTELTIIVDSDDILTRDAVKAIKNIWSSYRKMTKICGISFLRGYDEVNPIGDKYPKDLFISNHIECRSNMAIGGDKSEVFLTRVLKEFPFPEIDGEIFMGEGIVWNRMAHKYEMVYVNKIIYITEYLEGGLTKLGRALRIKCPIGGMINAKEGLSNRYKLKVRVKNILLYICYGFFAKKSFKDMCISSEHPKVTLLTLPFGYILYRYWKAKYLQDGRGFQWRFIF